MPVFDDSAILRAENKFIRPSDLLEDSDVKLLTITAKGDEAYQRFSIKPVYASYAKIRFSHGAILNLGFNNYMIGTIHTGYKNCKPLDTKDLVRDITKNFKYRSHITSDFYTFGDKDFFINLEEFTDKKTGIYNIATYDFYKFLGWCARTGRMSQGLYAVSVNKQFLDRYEGLIERLPLEVVSKCESSRHLIRFKSNWFIDVIKGLCGDLTKHFLADDIVFHCTHELAKAFREGFISCNCLRPYLKDAESTRYDCLFDDDNVGDLLFVIHRAGYPTIITNDTVGYRICEQVLTISEYVQNVEHIEVPKLMYEITPVSRGRISPIWVSGVLFSSNI